MKGLRVYGSKWDRARKEFLQLHPLCAMCKEQGVISAAAVVDHIVPHRLKLAIHSGNREEIAKAQKLFWDRKNWQGLCTSHHSSTKQRMEKRGHAIGCDEDGLPIGANKHWGGAG